MTVLKTKKLLIKAVGGGVNHVNCGASLTIRINGKLVDKKSGSGAAEFENIYQTAFDLAVEAKKDEKKFIKRYV